MSFLACMEWLLLSSALGCLAQGPCAGATCKRDYSLGRLKTKSRSPLGLRWSPWVVPGSLCWLQGVGRHHPRFWGSRKETLPSTLPPTAGDL